MVAEALAGGLRAEGVEPSRCAVKTAEEENGVHLLCGTLQECCSQLGRYDLITMIDVIEHVTDPVGLLKEAVSLLNSEGALVVATPDISSLAARVLGRRWWHFRPAHVGYFAGSGLHCVGVVRARWHLPLAYVLVRLKNYLPVPASGALQRIAGSSWAAAKEITLSLGDSRVFFARRAS